LRATELLALMCFNRVRAPDTLEPVTQQSNGEHDFDVMSPGGSRIGILEVTSTTERGYQGALEALHPNRGGGLVPAVACSHGWHVWPGPRVSIRAVRQKLDLHLSAIEAAGLEEFDQDEAHASVLNLREALRIESGRVTDEVADHHVVNLPGLTESLRPDALPDAIRTVASKGDNLAKLSNRAVAERHLFVCVDISTLAAYWQVDADYPVPPVSVDESITHLWAAKQMGAFWAVVLHAPNGGEWQKLTVSWSARDEPPVT